MPFYGELDPMIAIRRRIEAVKQVRAKYPQLIEGSSGWHRAIQNRLSRLAKGGW